MLNPGSKFEAVTTDNRFLQERHKEVPLYCVLEKEMPVECKIYKHSKI